MNKTLPIVLKATGINNKEIHEIARNICDIAQQQTFSLYEKIRRKITISPYYKMLFMILEGLRRATKPLRRA